MEIKDKIFNAAVQLFLQYGVKSVSMDDLARELGMSKKTIYNHFSNKKELVRFTMMRFLEHDEEIILTLIAKSNSALDEMFNITRHVQYLIRAMKPSLIFDLKKYYRDTWREIENTHFAFIQKTIQSNITRGMEEGIYRAGIKPDIIAGFYSKVSECAADEQLFPINKYSKVELFTQHVHYHLHGLVNDKGRKLLQEMDLTMLQSKSTTE